ncbi:MAG: DnaJ domain-containing protein [Chitinophagaceae bacterium]
MALKNYYACLGVSPVADLADIKTAFRTLAKKYHPDTAPENPFAAHHFAEVQEAYNVLSNPKTRAKYDQERWLRGMNVAVHQTIALTPDWILMQAVNLRKYMAGIDTYHMDHALLRDYLLFLLRDEHLSVLQSERDFQERLLDEILASAAFLKNDFLPEILERSKMLVGDDILLQEKLALLQQLRESENFANRLRPIVVICAALLIILVIFLLARRKG